MGTSGTSSALQQCPCTSASSHHPFSSPHTSPLLHGKQTCLPKMHSHPGATAVQETRSCAFKPQHLATACDNQQQPLPPGGHTTVLEALQALLDALGRHCKVEGVPGTPAKEVQGGRLLLQGARFAAACRAVSLLRELSTLQPKNLQLQEAMRCCMSSCFGGTCAQGPAARAGHDAACLFPCRQLWHSVRSDRLASQAEADAPDKPSSVTCQQLGQCRLCSSFACQGSNRSHPPPSMCMQACLQHSTLLSSPSSPRGQSLT